MKLFDRVEYNLLHTLFEKPGYAGYKPNTAEAPNGDANVDRQKRYLHIAMKYDPPAWAREYLARAHFEACRIAEVLGVPDHLYPRVADGTLRVLNYPAGASSAPHTDFDLFTVHCYRNTWEQFVRHDPVDPRAEAIDPDVHLGEIAELCGLGKATRHEVLPSKWPQFSIVYFAMPAHDADLPGGQTVGLWLAERYARSRVAI